MTGAAAWTWAQTVALLGSVIAIAGAVITAAVTYDLSQRAARRDRHTKAFAEALAVIEDYAELPYRIRRRRGSADARYELADEISQIQSRIAFHQAWLRMEAPDVAQTYDELVRTAKMQAGKQMQEAWQAPAAVKDSQMSLGAAYPREDINAARDQCAGVMREALRRRPQARAAGRRGSGPDATRSAGGGAPR